MIAKGKLLMYFKSSFSMLALNLKKKKERSLNVDAAVVEVLWSLNNP